MTCYHPLQGWWSREKTENGKRRVVFNWREGYSDLRVNVPCGQCIGCRLSYSRNWAIRCVHEASLHDENCFVTLTYDDSNVPDSGSLNRRHIQLFLKRLRKKFTGKKIRFYCCGEYGELLTRPHYHLILFGFDFEDKVLWSVRDGVRLYRSEILEKLWTYGYSTIGNVTYESAAYVARYCLKKRNGEKKGEYYKGLEQEFSTMSRRPGIARDWFEKFKGDVFPHDYVVISKGIKCKPPRYYDNIYDVIDRDEMQKIKQLRHKYLSGCAPLIPDGEDSVDRLEVKEKVQKSKLTLLKRSVE